MSKDAKVSGQYLEVLSSASRGAPVAFLMERGESFRFIKQKTDWLKVKSETGNTGWISVADYYDSGEYVALKNNKKKWNPNWGLGLSTGYFGQDKRYNATLAFQVFKALSVEANYSKISGDYSTSNFVTGDVLLHFFHAHRVRPFVSLAYGVFNNEPRKSLIKGDSSSENVSGYGVGLDVNPYKRLIMRFSLGNYQLNQSNKSYIDWRLGIFAHIG